MNFPANVCEADFLRATEIVVNHVCNTFKFGPYELEDIQQEARLIALRSLAGYNGKFPLENYLYTCVRTRLINFQRDNFRRNDVPCSACHNSLPGFTAHPDKLYCENYQRWHDSVLRKHNVNFPIDISNIDDDQEKNTRRECTLLADLEAKELRSLIDEKLPIELRSSFLQMLEHDSKVPKKKRRQVEDAVRHILEDTNG